VSITDKYRTPAALPSRIAVFPLRGCILLPRASMPINVFEPRYLEMIDDAISGSRVIGIIQPAAATEPVESPQGKDADMRKVGCAGRITAYQELEDNRLLITLTGIARFDAVGEAASDLPYRLLDVDYQRFAGDLEPGRGENAVDREKLLNVLKRYLEANQLGADWDAIINSPSELLVNVLSVVSPFSSEEKQALLEAADLPRRAEALIALAEMHLAAGHDTQGGTLQ
jgi:Lon protease-like protein